MTPPLGDVADICIHEMTTAFCSICKAQSRHAEKMARRRRTTAERDWGYEPVLPYPRTEAEYSGRCGGCDDRYDEGDTIYRADSMWVCETCAEEYRDLGVGPDG